MPFWPVPNRVKLVVVLGEPITVERVDEPTKEQVRLHKILP